MVCADNSINKENNNNLKDSTIVKVSALSDDLESDDDSDYGDDSDENDDSEDYDFPNYYEWEWKGNIYLIDLDQFDLTDEELTELFTKRDVLIEEVENLESMIETMEISRNDDILLAFDSLYDSINHITNNIEFNDLLLSLKGINITEASSTFEELKRLLGSIKEEYPDEDFTEIDYLMSNLETLLNEDL